MSIFECSNCGAQYPKWQGQCGECGKWGAISGQENGNIAESEAKIDPYTQNSAAIRLKVGISEVESVLGGGIVPGSLILLTGDPGIGKSTLVCQIIDSFCCQNQGQVLYVAGEESLSQISMRMSRIKSNFERVSFTSETGISPVINFIKKNKPSLVVVDSIQTVFDEKTDSAPGSPAQIRAVCGMMLSSAKQTNIPIIAIGHITKEGSFAGPQTLAHMVDVVLYLEGDSLYNYRLLRSVKNRFGPTNQVGVFTMGGDGLCEVKNPSELFLSNRKENMPGSVISVIVEGVRPFLVEIQALTNSTSYGYPKRAASGFDLSRLELILAVLQRRGGLKLQSQDVFVNIAGGLRAKDPALDLAAALAIASSLSNLTVPEKSIAIGEIGLAGEIRPVSRFEDRVSEARRVGFEKFLCPKINSTKSQGLVMIDNVTNAIEILTGQKK